MEEKKNRNDEIEEEQDDIEEIDEVYSHMLEKATGIKRMTMKKKYPAAMMIFRKKSVTGISMTMLPIHRQK